jgi:2-keto-4-pentenoate hydratase
MERQENQAVARELQSAYETGVSVSTFPSARSGFDLNAAYEIESELKRSREMLGAKSVGRKVGYANKAVWRVFRLQTLVWGHMYDDTVHYNDDNNALVAIAHPHSLKVEPEIVFGLKQPILTEAIDAQAALESTGWLAVGFEVIDCPFPDWKFQPSDFVAYYGLHAGLAVGERVQVRPAMIATLLDQLPQFKVQVAKNGEFVAEGAGRNSLASPAACLAELGTAILRRFPNEPLSAGELVSSGTLTPGHLTERGDTWKVEVTGLPLPPLTLRIS